MLQQSRVSTKACFLSAVSPWSCVCGQGTQSPPMECERKQNQCVPLPGQVSPSHGSLRKEQSHHVDASWVFALLQAEDSPFNEDYPCWTITYEK